MGGQVSSKDILYNGHHHVVLAGENTGSGLDNSALSLLSLQQSYPFPGAGGSGGVQIALGPGQTYAGNIIILMVHVKPKLSQPLKFYQMAQWDNSGEEPRYKQIKMGQDLVFSLKLQLM